MYRKIAVLFLVCMMGGLLLAGCGSSNQTKETTEVSEETAKGEQTEIQLFIAASLEDAFKELIPLYNETSPDVKVTYNADSFETYSKRIVMVAHKLAETIEDLYERVQEERDKDLPYGYVRDEDGNIQIDSIKADEVKKIYKMYIETPSMKRIAKELKTNFSHVRDILRDERYDKMQPRIISTSVWKQVEAIAKANQKNVVTKADTSRAGQLKKEMAQITRG